MLSNETLQANHHVSIYLKGLGWVNKSSTMTCDTDIRFRILDRYKIYEIIGRYNVPYLTDVVEYKTNLEDKRIDEDIYFYPTTDEENIQHKELIKELLEFEKTNNIFLESSVSNKRIPHLMNLLGLHGISKDVLADEIILTLKDKEDSFVKTYQVTDYLENNPCKHLSNKVCLNYARSLMISDLSKDLVESIITSDYEANINAGMELEVEASMVTLSGEKEFTRITRFVIDEGFLPELLQYATKYNEVLDEDSEEDSEIESSVVGV